MRNIIGQAVVGDDLYTDETTNWPDCGSISTKASTC